MMFLVSFATRMKSFGLFHNKMWDASCPLVDHKGEGGSFMAPPIRGTPSRHTPSQHPTFTEPPRTPLRGTRPSHHPFTAPPPLHSTSM